MFCFVCFQRCRMGLCRMGCLYTMDLYYGVYYWVYYGALCRMGCLYTMDFVSAGKHTLLLYVTVCEKVVPQLNKHDDVIEWNFMKIAPPRNEELVAPLIVIIGIRVRFHHALHYMTKQRVAVRLRLPPDGTRSYGITDTKQQSCHCSLCEARFSNPDFFDNQKKPDKIWLLSVGKAWLWQNIAWNESLWPCRMQRTLLRFYCCPNNLRCI